MEKEFKEMIQEDIKRITDVLVLGDAEQWELFRELDGKYQSCIQNWYLGMWESDRQGKMLFFPELKKYPEYIADNLKMAQAKLRTFLYGANATSSPNVPSTMVNVTTNVNLNLTFDQARDHIEEMTSLTDEQTKEIMDKIAEIEQVTKTEKSKKKKWETIKPILAWLANKSFDVAMIVLPLLLKCQNE